MDEIRTDVELRETKMSNKVCACICFQGSLKLPTLTGFQIALRDVQETGLRFLSINIYLDF